VAIIVGIIVLPSVGELEMEMEIELELELAIIVVMGLIVGMGIKPPIGGEMELRPPPRCIKRTLDVIF
jgi:hypothetical protein